MVQTNERARLLGVQLNEPPPPPPPPRPRGLLKEARVDSSPAETSDSCSFSAERRGTCITLTKLLIPQANFGPPRNLQRSSRTSNSEAVMQTRAGNKSSCVTFCDHETIIKQSEHLPRQTRGHWRRSSACLLAGNVDDFSRRSQKMHQ